MLNDIKKYQLSQETMSKFTENALAQCLEVLESLPETVYRVSDLLMVISDRNGFPWCENMLEALCKDVGFNFKTSDFQLYQSVLYSCFLFAYSIAFT